MARSVSVPYAAEVVAYAAFELDPDDYDYAGEMFDDARDNFRYGMKARYRSLKACSRWIDREVLAVLENDKVYVTVSEYNGLVAVAAVPKNPDSRAQCLYASKMNLDPVEYFGTRLVSRGRFSNGEQIFAAYKPEEAKGDLGLGFTSKEGWL